jgi:RNA polymerase sigma-70 factor (ECF subfamily)
MSRDQDNQRWIKQLSGSELEQASALTVLRIELLRRLRWALANYGLADEAFIEDCVQDALVLILDRLGQFEGRSKFLTWATTIAIRTGLSEIRRRRWKDVSLDQFVQEIGIPHQSTAPPKNPNFSREDQDSVVRELYSLINNTLTERQRTALLAELKGMPQVEIARQLGTTLNALYKLTHDARKKLKRGLESAGFTADELLNTTLH